MRFDRHFGSTAAEMPVKFPNNQKISLSISSGFKTSWDLAIRHLTILSIEAQTSQNLGGPRYEFSCSEILWDLLVRHIGEKSNLHRADSKFAPSQWETSLQSNAVSHWLGANLESALPPPWCHQEWYWLILLPFFFSCYWDCHNMLVYQDVLLQCWIISYCWTNRYVSRNISPNIILYFHSTICYIILNTKQ